ncbi:Glutaredoxin domain-containing protein [Cephalotus follicularis]|uniref:Glutaredoxin n=1 Tax=Cephalotus follicularis TaxID=3775 RepID=A0A1Q3BIS4_CEPFO|nr:Glutaredoxin domain-containing protein [Cephalotus follicularis]
MALQKAKEIVASDPVVVFSKTYCPYCVSVKKLLDQLGATYKPYELDTESDGSDIQSALKEWTGQKTVPNVFIGGKHIGGCDATTELNRAGKLVPLLTEAGAIANTSSA